MKKVIICSTLVAASLLISFSCKKSSSTTSTSTTPTPVTPQPSNTSSSFSVDGSSEGTNLTVIKGATSNGNSYEFLLVGSPWTMQVVFSGSNTPASGTYAIEDSTDTNIPAGKCVIVAAGPDNKFGRPHNGSVTVTTGASNSINFSNVLALQKDLSNNVTATYTLTGVIKY